MSGTIWTQPAQDDLAAIDDYHASTDSAFADRVGRTAIAAGLFLAEHPHAGAEMAAGLRRWRVVGTPYLLFYRIVADCVEVVRVQHDRRDRSAL